jgi:hypothetical protein
VAHACNPNHSGGRAQEDRGSKPAQANSWLFCYLLFWDPISKNKTKTKTHHKKGLVEWLKV